MDAVFGGEDEAGLARTENGNDSCFAERLCRTWWELCLVFFMRLGS